LFKPSDQPHGGNVVLNFTGKPKAELALVGDAYYNAARRLLEAFLELLIKAVLTIGNDLAGLLEEPSLRVKDIYADHSLAKNIPQLKRVFQAMGWEDAFEQAGMARGEFEQIIKEFEGFDPNSFTFRYPINKDGSASRKEKHFVFSPKQLTSEPIGVFELLFPSRQQSRQD
jgi:hypothetical protein